MSKPGLRSIAGGKLLRTPSKAQRMAKLQSTVDSLALRVDMQQRLIMSMIDALLATGVKEELIQKACAARNITFSIAGAAEAETVDAEGKEPETESGSAHPE